MGTVTHISILIAVSLKERSRNFIARDWYANAANAARGQAHIKIQTNSLYRQLVKN